MSHPPTCTSRALCLALLLGAGCSNDDFAQDSANLTAPWALVAEELPEALLSVWTGDGIVYAVGADRGHGPRIMRLQDGSWQQLDSGARGHLWWVAQGPDGILWMVGEEGLVLRHDPSTSEFTRVKVDTDRTLFGIHFSPGGSAWIVGGETGVAETAGDRGALLRLEGDTFVPVDGLSGLLEERALFKVWARADDDVWFVGEQGLVLHFDGDTYQQRDSGTRDRLVTVRGSADSGPLLVGGQSNARLLEHVDGELRDHSDDLDDGFAPALNGVGLSATGNTTVVGNRGFIAQRGRTGDAWKLIEQLTELHLHAVAVADDGQAWAVGGNILTEALDQGVLLHRGRLAAPEP